jgi:hypothetical protein
VSDEYDTSMVELVELLLTVCKMTGYEPPEAPAWRKTIAEREVERARRLKALGGERGMQKMMEVLSRAMGSSERGKRQDSHAVSAEDWKPADSDAHVPAPGIASPIRREAPKVGRNDPCPCGSGKKYKKCCGSGSKAAAN